MFDTFIIDIKFISGFIVGVAIGSVATAIASQYFEDDKPFRKRRKTKRMYKN